MNHSFSEKKRNFFAFKNLYSDYGENGLQYDFPKAGFPNVFPKILGGIIIMLAKIFRKTSIRKIGFREIVG
jgi:hypothetical protein